METVLCGIFELLNELKIKAAAIQRKGLRYFIAVLA